VLGLSAAISFAQDVQTVRISHIGKDTENGVRMAIDDLNAQALVIGGKKIKFEIAAEDDAGEPGQATAVAQKLCGAKVAGVVGHLQSGTTIPASSIYNKCGLPHITAAAKLKGIEVVAEEYTNDKATNFTANIAFIPKGELTTPAVTLYRFQSNQRVALN
jgi:hypothetical protein